MPRRMTLVTLLSAAVLLWAVLAGVTGCSKKAEEGGVPADTSATSTETPMTDTAGTPSGGAMVSGGGVEHGKEIFLAKCQTCHGPDGRGDGPLAASLNPKPRNYHDTAYMSTKTDEELFSSIKNGKGQMPAWGAQGLSDQDIRDVLAFVRSLGK